MNIKETFQSILQNQKKNIYYWLSVIAIIDVGVATNSAIRFLQSGQCRNYLVLNSALHSCSALEFAKNGWSWISFVDIFMFVPAALLMIITSMVLSEVFAKKE
jgi:hypothetical protein